MTWDWIVVREILPSLLSGLKLTLIATACASALSVVLGMIWAIGRRSRTKILVLAISTFTEFIRRTPLLVQLYFVFLVAPSMGLTLSPMLSGILTLGLHYSTYTAEIYRAGIDSIAAGQWEAAHTLDMPTTKVWSKVILPQAVPRVIPAIGNTVIAMFKETALLSAITVQELMGVARGIGATTYIYTEPLLVAGALYLIVSYGSSLAIRALERRIASAQSAPRTAKNKATFA